MSSDDPTTPAPSGPSAASTNRLIVLEVSATPSSKLIRTLDTSSNAEILIALCDEWVQTSISPADIVRVVQTNPDGTYSPFKTNLITTPADPVLVTSDINLLIQHPDTLITGTSVADSFLCLRKSVLNSRVPQRNIVGSAGGEAALFGSMIHDLFQHVLVLDSAARKQHSSLDIMEVYESIEELLVQNLESLYATGISEKHARLVLHKIVPEIVSWHDNFMRIDDPSPGLQVPDKKSLCDIAVTDVHDIEELIWSPVLGLKGKVDATVRLRKNGTDAGMGIFELKTGSSQGYSAVSHSAQVSLYSLLMSDRYSRHVDISLLTYIRYQEALAAVRENEENVDLKKTKSSLDHGPNCKVVTTQRAELVGLIMQRNRLASYLRRVVPVETLPPPIKNSEKLCKKCFSNDNCLLQYRLLEDGDELGAKDGPGVELFREKAAHLTDKHAAYYKFWRRVLAAEEEYAGREQNGIWSRRGSQREEDGQCVANLQLVVSANASEEQKVLLAPGKRKDVEFVRHKHGHPLGDFAGQGLSQGDYVVVSAESRSVYEHSPVGYKPSTKTWQSGVSSGFIRSISKNRITVMIDRSLIAWAHHQGVSVDNVCWRVDAEEIYASHSTAKNTLENLFIAEEALGLTRLRELIVDASTPKFTASDEAKRDISKSCQSKYDLKLNADQERALELSLRARDYVLILGMPGTGKTTTLCAIVLAAVMQNKSVLLCSHTNAAVDNVLLRLLSMGFEDFIRLGRKTDVIASRIHPFHISKFIRIGKTVEQLEKDLDGPRVVATTCLGINHPIFCRRSKFDLVVIDEASQILQPISIGPLQFTDGPFILVGDHYQLPPLLRAKHEDHSKSALNTKNASSVENEVDVNEAMSVQETATTESLFRRLCEAHPDSMVSLSKQYRMAADIMRLSNELVYCGSLSCGSDAIAAQKLDIPIGGLSKLSPWLKAVRNPARRVLFLDVVDDSSPTIPIAAVSSETESKDKLLKRRRKSEQASRENSTEASVIVTTIQCLVQGGMKSEEITVLSPFRAQVFLVKDAILRAKSQDGIDIQNVDVFTVDQYQGKDNKCIIVSFVRHSSDPVGPLLKDWRRINVALTRAKQKLILVGCSSTIAKGSNFLGTMISDLESRKLVIPVSFD